MSRLKFLIRNHFILWNAVALLFVKVLFVFSGFGFATLLTNTPTFTKEEVVAQTNIFRSALGLGQLKENSTLDSAALSKLQDMINGNYFAHTSPSGISPWHWIEANNYKYSYAGENLAIGFYSAKDTEKAWENSPSHRENLLNQHYKEIGVAVAPAKINNSEGILVVQVFGTPKPIKPEASAKTAVAPKTTPKPNIVAIAQTPISTPVKSLITTSPSVKSAENSVGISQAPKPISINLSQDSPKINTISKVLNSGFVIYSLFIFLLSIVLIVYTELNKGLVISSAVHLALFLFAIFIPVLHMTRTALIF